MEPPRDVLSYLWAPVCAIGAVGPHGPNAQLSVSVFGASIVPERPRLTLNMWNGNYTTELVRERGSLSITMLSEEQVRLLEPLGLRSGRNGPKLSGIDYRLDELGNPVFALSNLAADRFGQFLVRVGKIKPDQLDDVAVVAQQTGRRTGDVLVERGLLKDTERLYYVGQQVKIIIYSLFGWEEAQFVVTYREKARSESIKLDVFPGNLIVRGIKKLYKPERLARLVRPEDRLMPSQQPAYQLHELELDKWEAGLLSRLDGTRTNAEVFALSGKPEHQVRAFLAALLGVEILERRES